MMVPFVYVPFQNRVTLETAVLDDDYKILRDYFNTTEGFWWLAKNILERLEYIHRAGIVHCDLAPSKLP